MTTTLLLTRFLPPNQFTWVAVRRMSGLRFVPPPALHTRCRYILSTPTPRTPLTHRYVVIPQQVSAAADQSSSCLALARSLGDKVAGLEAQMRDLAQQRDQGAQVEQGQQQQQAVRGSGSGAVAGADVQALSGRLAEVEGQLREEVARLRAELGEALQVGLGGVGVKGGRGYHRCFGM